MASDRKSLNGGHMQPVMLMAGHDPERFSEYSHRTDRRSSKGLVMPPPGAVVAPFYAPKFQL